MKRLLLLSFLLLQLAGVRGQSLRNKTWVGSNLEYLRLTDSTANVDISRLISANGFTYRYVKTATEHSLSFGTPSATTIPTDTGRAWINYYSWQKVEILSLTEDTLILNYSFVEHSILDSIYGQRHSGYNPKLFLNGNAKPIVFVDSSKVFGDFQKFQQLSFRAPTENIEVDSAGNFKSWGYILDASRKFKNYTFSGKLKRKELKQLVARIKQADIKRIPSNENEPMVYDGHEKSFLSVKADGHTYYYASKHRQLYWLRSQLIFPLIRLHKKLNKERADSPFANEYDFVN